MTERTDGGFAPSIADMEFEQLWTWWSETYGIAPSAARWLALYQYGGGNALGGLINRADPFDTEFHYAERPIC